MRTIEVLHDLQARDIRLTVDGDQLRYDAPEDAITEEVLSCLRQHKTALLMLLKQEHASMPAPMVQNAKALSNAPALAAPAFVTPLGSKALQTDTGAWRCHCCHGTRHWRSIYGAVVCARCHPPAAAPLVAAWAGEDMETTLDT